MHPECWGLGGCMCVCVLCGSHLLRQNCLEINTPNCVLMFKANLSEENLSTGGNLPELFKWKSLSKANRNGLRGAGTTPTRPGESSFYQAGCLPTCTAAWSSGLV